MTAQLISVIVPLHNEEENIAILQSEIATALSNLPHELILVDDGSTDNTLERIIPGPSTRTLRFRRNAGQSAAMIAGLRNAKGDILVLLDGDLQNDPADIPGLLREIENGADLVCGYRVKRRDSRVKKLTSRIANTVRSRFVGDGVRDTGCTLKAMRGECLKAITPFAGMHRFIPALVKSAGFRVVEVPVNHRQRKFGVSKYGLRNRALRATIDMLGVRWLQSRRIDYDLM